MRIYIKLHWNRNTISIALGAFYSSSRVIANLVFRTLNSATGKGLANQLVIEARRTRNANMNILEKMADICSLEITGSLNSDVGDAHQTDALPSLRVDTSEQSNHTSEGLPVPKRPRIIGDLNRSPMCTEEYEEREAMHP